MLESTYRQALSGAWKLVWKNKIIWILGLFSALLGQLGFSDVFGKALSISENPFKAGIDATLYSITARWHWDIWNGLGLLWIGIIILSLVIFIVFLASTSQGALIYFASQWFKNNKFSNLAKSWHQGVAHFWKVLGINIIRRVSLFILLLGFGFILKFFLISQGVYKSFGFAAALLLLFFLSLCISTIAVYSLCYAVAENKTIIQSFKFGWDLFSRHLLVSIEIGITLMVFNLLLVAVIFTGGYLAFLPATLIWVAAGLTNAVLLAAAGLALGLFLWFIFAIIAAAIFNTFTTSAWVYLFTKMHKDGMASRILHMFKHFTR